MPQRAACRAPGPLVRGVPPPPLQGRLGPTRPIRWRRRRSTSTAPASYSGEHADSVHTGAHALKTCLLIAIISIPIVVDQGHGVIVRALILTLTIVCVVIISASPRGLRIARVP